MTVIPKMAHVRSVSAVVFFMEVLILMVTRFAVSYLVWFVGVVPVGSKTILRYAVSAGVPPSVTSQIT